MVIEFEKLTIDVVENFHKQLVVALDGADGELDFSNVKKIDITAIQLLFSFKKSCDKYDIPFKVTNLSSSIQKTLELTGSKSELFQP